MTQADKRIEMAKSGKSARSKGNNYEVMVCKILTDKGFSAVSSRSESKRLDDLGADVVSDFPFYIQCKAVERMSMPVHDLLKQMKNNLPDKPSCIFHKRNNKGTVVSLELDDFLNLIK